MSSPEIPTTMRALITQKTRTLAVQTVPVPKLQDGEVLVKIHSVALNPTDWKHSKFISAPGTLAGIDFSGVVVQVGNNIDPKVSYAIGDRVAGSVHGGTFTDKGSFAEYARVNAGPDAGILWKIPDEFSMEDAAAMGVGLMTAIQAMFHPERMAMVEYPNKAEEGTWFFVYSGSTSVGQYAIQMAHVSGYKVVTIASPRHHELLKSLGAELTFDYKDPQWMQKVKEATGDSIHLALDCFCEGESAVQTVKTLGPGNGKVWTLWFPSKPVTLRKDEVKVDVNLLYSIWGTPFKMMGKTYPADQSDVKQMAIFLRDKLPELVKEEKLKANPVKLWEGGLAKVEDGFKYMIAGKVSGEKLVYNI